MAKLDAIVVENLAERLFQPERLKLILGKIAERQSEQAAEVDQRVAILRSESTAAEDKLKRLYAMVEIGFTELDDILKNCVAALKTDRDRAMEALDRIKLRPKPHNFDDEAIERFGRLMRENVASGPIPFRKAYIKSVVDRVEVDDHAICILGDRTTLQAGAPLRRPFGQCARPSSPWSQVCSVSGQFGQQPYPATFIRATNSGLKREGGILVITGG